MRCARHAGSGIDRLDMMGANKKKGVGEIQPG